MIHDNIYETTYRVHTYHADPYLQASFPFYCRAVQEGAATHAYEAGCSNPDLHDKGKSWVLSRLKLTVNSYISWPADIVLRTWIQEPFKFFAPREALGTDTEGNELFRSMAYWVIIDLDRRRPVKPDVLRNFISMSQDRSLWSGTKLKKLPVFDPEPAASTPYKPKIMYRDIDSVRHINNISYIEWILDSFSPEHKKLYQISEFEINFISESFLGNSLELFSEMTGPVSDGNHGHKDLQVFDHLLLNGSGKDKVTACRARSTWVPRVLL